MGRPLTAIVSAIHNNIIKGTDGTQNKPYTFDQIADDVDTERSTMVVSGLKTRILTANDFLQSFTTSCLEEVDCPLNEGKKAWRFLMPPLVEEAGRQCVTYAGAPGYIQANSFAVYLDEGIRYHHTRRFGSKRPALWVNTPVQDSDEEDGIRVECFLINAPKLNKVMVRGIFRNPRQLLPLSGEERLYPVPDLVAKDLIHNISQKYLLNYRGGQKGMTAAQLAALSAANAQPQQQQAAE